MASTTHLRKELYAYAKERGVIDPITQIAPDSENSITGVLCLKAQQGKIAWKQIQLFDIKTKNEVGKASNVFKDGVFVSEYKLLHSNENEEKIWGGMPADIVHMHSSSECVVLLEIKIGGNVGYESNNPESNQIARQLDFLANIPGSRIKRLVYVFVTTRGMAEQEWYKEILEKSLNCKERSKKVDAYLVKLEDIFDACEPTK